MTDDVKTTPTEAVIPETVVAPTEETPQTMEQIQQDIAPVKETVGLDKFLDLKKQNKEKDRLIKDLEAKIEAGATRQEVSADMEAISEEYPDVDRGFLNKLANTIKNSVVKEAEDKITSRFQPLEEKDRQAKIDNAFNTHFKIAIDKMPEFATIVNPDVIKTLSQDPRNASKTFSQIIEETYGNALTGKRTIETTISGGGKDSDPLNFQKARVDSNYFDVVMANPRLKAEYNNLLISQGF